MFNKKTVMSNKGVQGFVVLIALLVSIIAGVRLQSELHRAPFQPKGVAFGIWGLIYSTLAISGVTLMNNPINWVPVILLAFSLLFSAGWVVTVSLENKIWSAIFITVATLCAMACVSLLRPDIHNPIDWCICTGPSLLAGWLGVAMGLGINIAYHNKTETDLSGWILAPGGVLATVVGIISGSPTTGLPLIWAAILSKRSSISLAVGSLGIITVGFATFRGIYENG